MIYIIPTKKGFGVEIWGTFNDLNNFYNVISKFWNENNLNKRGFENRDKLISGFSYEIRKAKDGSRLKRKSGHFSFEEDNWPKIRTKRCFQQVNDFTYLLPWYLSTRQSKTLLGRKLHN